MRRLRILVASGVAAALALLLAVPAAFAHPMGNFSINHYASLQIGKNQLRILYVVDMAEIPTFQELSNIGADASGNLAKNQRATYLPAKIRQLRQGLQVLVNGRVAELQTLSTDLLFPPGAGGLPTERIYALFGLPLSTRHPVITYRDGNFAGRAGWKEIVAAPTRGTKLTSSATQVDRSKALTIYPTTISSSPPQDLHAVLTVDRFGSPLISTPNQVVRSVEAPLFNANGGWSALAQGLTRIGTYSTSGSNGSAFGAGRIDGLTNLIKHGQLSLGLLLVSLVVAFWFGAGHALSPGHGKTVVAAYLVGNRGTPVHAALLGLTVTVTHTSGVFALGLVTLYLSHYVVPDQLYPWLGFASGSMVATMGLVLFVRRFGALRRRSSRSQLDDGHDHLARHAHTHHGHEHSHLPQAHHTHGEMHRHGWFGKPHSHAAGPARDPLSLKSLVALGVSGGLLPCPSALVVLLSAIAFHRIAFGLLLIVAFSLGLATTLTSVGLAMVLGRRLLARLRSERLTAPSLLRIGRAIPAFSALVVAALGTIIAFGALGAPLPVAL